MKIKLIMGLVIISVVITSISGCVEQQADEKQQEEIQYDDELFLAWIREDANSTDYYNNQIQIEMAKDFEDTDFSLLISYSKARRDIISQSEDELELFILSPKYEEIRESWKNALMNRWMVDYYLIVRIETLLSPEFDEQKFSKYSDLVVDFTESAAEDVAETARLIEEL